MLLNPFFYDATTQSMRVSRVDSDHESVTEDTAVVGDQLITSGTLTVSDLDDGEGAFDNASTTFKDAGSTNGAALGQLTITSDGNWSYSVDNTLTEIQALGVTESITEIFTVGTADGAATRDITVTIQGANDPSAISEIGRASCRERV